MGTHQSNFNSHLTILGRWVGIVLCFLGILYILFSGIKTPENFRVLSDIVQTVLVTFLVYLLFIPEKRQFTNASKLGIFVMIYDFLLETVAVALDWWYPIGGTQLEPILIIPLEMVLSFWLMGVSTSIIFSSPEIIRKTELKSISWLKKFFKHSKFDNIFRISIILLLAIVGTNGDYTAGPTIWVAGPKWHFIYTFIVWMTGGFLTLLVYLKLNQKVITGMKLKGVIFDLDGTLIDFKIDYQKTRETAIKILEHYGISREKLDLERLIISMVKNGLITLKKLHDFDEKRINEIRHEISDKIAKVEGEAAEKATVLNGMLEVLKYLRESNILTAIMTFNTTQNAITSLKSARITKFFPNHEVIVGRDSVQNQKPDPEHAQYILDKWGLKADDVCIIGDHPKDIQTAENIHARSIAITTEKHPPEEFKTQWHVKNDNVAEYILKTLSGFM
jgi:phosphoglycolate phosphatase-like HAD superfamily hydrolase